MDPAVVGAVVAGLSGLIVASITARSAHRAQVRQEVAQQQLADQQATQQLDLAKLQARSAEEQARRNARRDYEYEARKRLYSVYEPIRFQLVDAAGNALRRMSEIAVARPPSDQIQGSMITAGYHLKGTIYFLLAPLALVRLLDRNLTLIDLRLERQINAEYNVAKTLYRTMADDELLANISPTVVYTPYVANWRELRVSDPCRYRRQGLPMGRLDNAVDALLDTGRDGIERLASFNTFEERFEEVDAADVRSGLGSARDLFDDFSIEARCVLWRVLVTQALLYGVYLHLALGGDANISPSERGDLLARSLHEALHDRRRLDLYWDAPTPATERFEPKTFDIPLKVALAYYRLRLAPERIV
jgi:hypothetical protein